MTVFGITISSHSGLWVVLSFGVAWLILCAFFWSIATSAGNADEMAGRK